MKKLLLGSMAVFATLTLSAQNKEVKETETSLSRAKEATQEGNIMVGVNASNIGFTSVKDGATNINAGVSVGAFAKDGLAVVANLGYATTNYNKVNTNDWFYGAGIRYYLGSVVPLQVDWKGSVGNSFHPGASFVGVQGGYAWFPFKNFSVEPTVRYDWSTKDQYSNVFSGQLGLNLFF